MTQTPASLFLGLGLQGEIHWVKFTSTPSVYIHITVTANPDPWG